MIIILTYTIPRLDIDDTVDYFIYYQNSNIYAVVGHDSFVAARLRALSDGNKYGYLFRCDYYDRYLLVDDSWTFIETVRPSSASVEIKLRLFTFYYDYSILRINEKNLVDTSGKYLLFSSINLCDESSGEILVSGKDVLRSTPYVESIIYPTLTIESMSQPILDELSSVFVISLSCIILYISIRKGIRFIFGLLRGA